MMMDRPEKVGAGARVSSAIFGNVDIIREAAGNNAGFGRGEVGRRKWAVSRGRER